MIEGAWRGLGGVVVAVVATLKTVAGSAQCLLICIRTGHTDADAFELQHKNAFDSHRAREDTATPTATSMQQITGTVTTRLRW